MVDRFQLMLAQCFCIRFGHDFIDRLRGDRTRAIRLLEYFARRFTLPKPRQAYALNELAECALFSGRQLVGANGNV